MEISQKIADSYVATNKKMKKMTIDEAKSYLEVENLGISTTCKHFKANVKAMQIMEKYQKIVNIVSLNDEEFKQCGLKELKEILEVIADRSEEESDNT